ncbi:hypothetical protein [Maribellus sp. YY47]|uniref:hypothetical protein n=1 Tax=Maribellus sp. YY47 TaxID=2929486 RepID=UPI002000FAB5|nr:hypothetical protein [Maribellus sp. YY47]MCK3682507.1 hypothetical protein [Maribellus sp. YY47]
MKKLILLTILISTSLLWSCKDIEKKTISNEEATTLLTESITAYALFSSTQQQAFRYSEESENLLKSASGSNVEYPRISVEPLDLTTWPKTITINYGSENLEGIDGRMRRGSIVISAGNFASVDNASWVITFDDFYQDNYKIEGTQTVQNKGLNSNNHPEYSCKIEDGVITSPDGRVFHFEQQTTREWIAGSDTHLYTSGNAEDFCDDEYLISGTHKGVSSHGYLYEMSTKQNLHTNVCCRWIMEGILSVTLPDNDLKCEINFHPSAEADDLCNNQALFKIMGEQLTITLP